MSREKAVEALKATRKADSEAKRQAVRDALAEAVSEGAPLTLSAIAARAGVSRQFLYSNPDLRTLVEQAAHRPSERPMRPPATSDVEDGLRATKGLLAAKVERLRDTVRELRARIDDLESQRKRWLGTQLDAQATVDPVEHAELRAAADRLMDDNASLNRKVRELERLNSIYESDLAAVRQALVEALAGESGAKVMPLHP